MASYEEIVAGLTPAMRADQGDRVALLRQVLAAAGHPDRHYRIIHLAGTNGKGSTGQFLTQLLMQTGAKVGHFASPALVDDREQVQVNNQPIEKAAFVASYQRLVAKLPRDIAPADLTVFEWWTLVALDHFAAAGVDWAVIECGLGGEKDATNAIDAPAAAVITHLALDHCRILGDTLELIASAKSGIIKAGSQAVVVTPEQDPVVLPILRAAADRAQVPLVVASDRVQVAPAGAGQMAIVRPGHAPLTTAVGLRGSYQSQNLTTALATLDALEIELSETDLTAALAHTQLPGRFQVLRGQPPVVLDAAHNPDGARHLITALQAAYPGVHYYFVVGFLADKNVAEMTAMYRQLSADFWLVTPDHPTRALPASRLQDYLPTGQIVSSAAAGLEAAKAAAQAAAGPAVIVVTGSFYTLKEVFEHAN